jgi:hypothetical protein
MRFRCPSCKKGRTRTHSGVSGPASEYTVCENLVIVGPVQTTARRGSCRLGRLFAGFLGQRVKAMAGLYHDWYLARRLSSKTVGVTQICYRFSH